MNRKAAEIHAIAWANAPGDILTASRGLVLVDDDPKLMEVKRAELARFLATIIERDLKFSVYAVAGQPDLLMIFTDAALKQEYDIALAEADRGGAAGWTFRRLGAIKSIFPLVDGVDSNEYLPPRRPSSGIMRGRAKRWHAKNIGGST